MVSETIDPKKKDNDREEAHYLFEGGFSPAAWLLPLLR